jgi:hypothetical protein
MIVPADVEGLERLRTTVRARQQPTLLSRQHSLSGEHSPLACSPFQCPVRALDPRLPFHQLNWVDGRANVVPVGFLADSPIALAVQRLPLLPSGQLRPPASNVVEHRLVVALDAPSFMSQLSLRLFANSIEVRAKAALEVLQHLRHKLTNRHRGKRFGVRLPQIPIYG